MTLPEIPDDAVDAAEGAMNHTIFGSYSRSHEAALLAITAAWPHLYAAAARHVLGDLYERTDEVEIGGRISLEHGRELLLHNADQIHDWLRATEDQNGLS